LLRQQQLAARWKWTGRKIPGVRSLGRGGGGGAPSSLDSERVYGGDGNDRGEDGGDRDRTGAVGDHGIAGDVGPGGMPEAAVLEAPRGSL